MIKELIGSRTALFMAKLTKITYFCSLRGKIDSETGLKPSTRSKYFSFTYFQLNWGFGNNQGGRIFSKYSQRWDGGWVK